MEKIQYDENDENDENSDNDSNEAEDDRPLEYISQIVWRIKNFYTAPVVKMANSLVSIRNTNDIFFNQKYVFKRANSVMNIQKQEWYLNKIRKKSNILGFILEIILV